MGSPPSQPRLAKQPFGLILQAFSTFLVPSGYQLTTERPDSFEPGIISTQLVVFGESLREFLRFPDHPFSATIHISYQKVENPAFSLT